MRTIQSAHLSHGRVVLSAGFEPMHGHQNRCSSYGGITPTTVPVPPGCVYQFRQLSIMRYEGFEPAQVLRRPDLSVEMCLPSFTNTAKINSAQCRIRTTTRNFRSTTPFGWSRVYQFRQLSILVRYAGFEPMQARGHSDLSVKTCLPISPIPQIC